MQQDGRRYRDWKTVGKFAFGFLLLLRVLLSSRLPSYILPDMPHDDGWVISRAMYILKGQWLGPYDQFTLIKGAFAPLLLAFSGAAGVSFSTVNTVMYCFACVVFIIAVRPIIRNPLLQFLLFAVLLFNPISYALDTYQRVYRNGIGQWQILLIFGCLIAVYVRRQEKGKDLAKWVIGAGLAFGTYLQTREDGTWIYPFVLGSIFVTSVVYWIERTGPLKKIAVFVLPVGIAFSLGGVVALKNYGQYGAPIVNDRGGGNFAKVAGDLYAITPNPQDEKVYESGIYRDKYYNIYVSTMEKAFAASPSLNGASGAIRDAIRMWASWEDIKNGEVSTDHMLFALRDGVRSAGYYRSLPETEAYYAKVHEELKAAFDNGTLIKRGFPISPLIKRLQLSDLGTVFSLMPVSIRNIADFHDVSARVVPSLGSATGLREANLLAGGEYFTSAEALTGQGWAFSEDNGSRLTAGLYDKQGGLIAILPFQGGKDVFESYKSKFQNATNSRFSFSVEGYNLKSGVKLRFFDQGGKLVWEIPADGSVTCGGTDGSFHYCIDSLKSQSSTSKFSPVEFYGHLVARANRVIGVYRILTPFFSILACLIYFAATVQLLREIRRRQALKTLDVWLFLTGLGVTFLIFMLAMCIITATSFNSMTYLYTGPAYELLLMFCGISVLWGVQAILEFRKREQR